ncbi:shikimate dehydrogenase [Aminipila butyrica]|uniref:Shikimate dehydrogenase n=1 Tax=Aminipila butyrica TaxID=433296 RepID=A0A858BVE6_9FIRM|nr:shikimate dehydrogenase [Aminipila butyrica]QIB68046.1 shikimate dehydrogenase [Aminipila butyrica]
MMYGLIGEKLGHSYSKIIHEKLGAYTYDLCPLTAEALDGFLKTRNFKGLNVTIPYKQTVMPYCDWISPLAKEIGAVNTLYFDKEGRLCGTNTDYQGVLYALKQANISISHKKVIILGDGATCKTIRQAVLDLGARELIIASRKTQDLRMEEISTTSPCAPYEKVPCTTLNYRDLDSHRDGEILINSTPVGMWPHTAGQPADLQQFPACDGVFDVVYNPYYTNFIQQAKNLNIPYASGLAMLVAQATAAAGYFTGKTDFEASNQDIIADLKKTFLPQTVTEEKRS